PEAAHQGRRRPHRRRTPSASPRELTAASHPLPPRQRQRGAANCRPPDHGAWRGSPDPPPWAALRDLAPTRYNVAARGPPLPPILPSVYDERIPPWSCGAV